MKTRLLSWWRARRARTEMPRELELSFYDPTELRGLVHLFAVAGYEPVAVARCFGDGHAYISNSAWREPPTVPTAAELRAIEPDRHGYRLRLRYVGQCGLNAAWALASQGAGDAAGRGV